MRLESRFNASFKQAIRTCCSAIRSCCLQCLWITTFKIFSQRILFQSFLVSFLVSQIIVITFYLYRGGPLMTAIIVLIGTIYDCNLHFKVDQIWLQRWSGEGLNMTTISIPYRTIYDCNPFQKGPNMIAMSKVVLTMIPVIFGPFWKGLQ